MDRGSGRAGFVLAGGRSSRMGRDKALLPYGASTLVEHVAARVEAAAGNVALVGPPDRYSRLGYRVIPDLHPGAGPAAGIEAALRASSSSWNLVLACDMPAVPSEFMLDLLRTAEETGARCVVAAPPSSRLEPLCAVYRRDAVETIGAALRAGIRRMSEIVAALDPSLHPAPEAAWFENVNTPEDWSRHHTPGLADRS